MRPERRCATCQHWAREGERPVGAGPAGSGFTVEGPRECRSGRPAADIIMVPVPRSPLAPSNVPQGMQPSVMSYHPLTMPDHWCGEWCPAHGLKAIRIAPSRVGGLTRAPTVEEYEEWMAEVSASGSPQIPLDGTDTP